MNPQAALDGQDDHLAEPQLIVLHLYIAGTTLASRKAVVNARRFCEEHLKGRYELKVLDVSREPQLAADEQLIALPTLVKKRPAPPHRFIGDLADTERLEARLCP
jgi:circadian clock protein KaiB